MAFKLVIFACALAAANAGLIGAPVAYGAAAYAAPGYPSVQPSITSQSSNILRSFGNVGQIATQSKTIDTPYSSQYKSDVRVSNPSVHTYAAAPLAYSAPIAHAPVAYSAPIAHAPVAYSAPIAHAPVAYSSPIAHAPVAYAAAPALAHAAPIGYAAEAPVVKSGLLGVAYSPANVVSHMSYSAPAIGLSYGW